MIKTISQYAQKQFAEYMARHHPDFRKVRVSLAKTVCPSGDVYAKVVDKERTGWIIFGGLKSSDRQMYAAIGWTRSGLKFLELPYWDGRKHPDIPDDGLSNLVDKELIGNDWGPNGRFVEVAEPSNEVKEKALSCYKTTDRYKGDAESIGASVVKKNPAASNAEIQAALNAADRGNMAFLQLWSEVVDHIELDDALLAEITRPALDETYRILSKYGFSFLDARLN